MERFEFKKSLGQNFIKDENVVNKIVSSASIDKDTLVIEIGPGAGWLSKKIIPLSKNTILYEIDTRLRDILNKELTLYDNYELIFNDVLKEDISSDISKYNFKKLYVVANIPYYITSPILKKLMFEVYPDKIIIMVQDEVASRLAAMPGSRDYGLMTVLFNSRYNIKKLFKVGKNSFVPIPKVDSAVVEMVKENKYEIKDDDVFDKLISDAFQYKRKTIKNNLKGYDLNKLSLILDKYGYSLSDRAESIPVNVFIEMANVLS